MGKYRFIDEVSIIVEGGKGGDGAVHFRREKYMPKGGPDGGDGGRGGNVYFVGSSSLYSLLDFKYKRYYKAEDGENARGDLNGRKGEDLYIPGPLGTLILDQEPGQIIAQTLENGPDTFVPRGGEGGLGNKHFATSTARSPSKRTLGKPGEKRRIRLILKVLADVGLVGFPNAGKTSLLNALTGTGAKVGDWEFTTLSPNLGVIRSPYCEITVGDIPGIIEGASEGRGLGLEFLKHLDRVRMLMFVLDGTRDPIRQYEVLVREIGKFRGEILEKPRIVVLNKIDLLDEIPNLPFEFLPVSAKTGEGIEELRKTLINLLCLQG
jgi:GTP-binding protein